MLIKKLSLCSCETYMIYENKQARMQRKILNRYVYAVQSYKTLVSYSLIKTTTTKRLMMCSKILTHYHNQTNCIDIKNTTKPSFTCHSRELSGF